MWRCIVDKIISQKTYWVSFRENNPDPEPFRAFIATDPLLTKIFNIVAIPDIIKAFDAYPFDEKLSEFSSISKTEIQYLYDLRSTKGFEKNLKVAEYLDWLVAVYELVHVTIWYYQTLKKLFNFSGEELTEIAVSTFREQFSIDEEFVYENNKGERYTAHAIGRKFPNIMLKILEHPGKVPIPQLHFRDKPTDEQIQYYKNNFDAGSVVQFRKFSPHAEEITYGGFDPHLDQTGLYYSNPNLKKDRIKSEKYIIEFYYQGKRIDQFDYSIRSRNKKKLLKAAKGKKEPEIRDESLRFAEDELLRLIKNFRESEGKPPEYYFSASLKHIGENIFKSESTEAVPTVFGEIKRISKRDLEHSGEKEIQTGEKEIPGGYDDKYNELKPNPFAPEVSESTYQTVEHKDCLTKIKQLICKDEIDIKILELIQDGTGNFKDSDEINYSAIARELHTYKNDVERRLVNIKRRARKNPSLKNFRTYNPK